MKILKEELKEFSNESKSKFFGSNLREVKKEINFSEGIFPTNLSCAMGHPPIPFIVPSNRKHPAENAAFTFSYQKSGWVWKCAPNEMAG